MYSVHKKYRKCYIITRTVFLEHEYNKGEMEDDILHFTLNKVA